LPDIEIRRDDIETRLETFRKRNHPDCILCGPNNGLGLEVEFSASKNGDVAALVECNELLQGYTGILHGGIIALLLDSAMTNCLFAAGIAAVTGEMSIRYLHSAGTDRPVLLTARITRKRPPLFLLRAEMHQGENIAARASGKFMLP